MKKDNKAKNIMTYVILVGLIFVALSYFLVYKKCLKQADSIVASNKTLSARVAVLKDYYDKSADYKKDISDMEAGIKDMLEPFPSDVREENVIRVAIDSLLASEKSESTLRYTALNIDPKEAVNVYEEETVKNAAIEGYDNMLVLANRHVSYNTKSDYPGVKDIAVTINELGNTSRIDNILINRNISENTLETVTETSYFLLIGTDKPYEEVKFTEYEAGLFDLFKLKVAEDEEVDDEEAKAE